ncbi:MAG: asparaginase [Microthrixaceae bacterium]|nr:asparaginase [Microthrixaceae bacterium]
MSKPLNLLSCGGAITSMTEEGLTRPTSPALVAALVQELWLTPVAHTAVSAVDSAAATPGSWTGLLEMVRGTDDPVLVTHGTDTLAWTAAALAVTDVADDRPVVMTGANVPFGELTSDARNNLAAALTVCRQMEKGVWVVFAGSVDGPAVVIEGGFARKTLPTGSCITDVSDSAYATVSAEVLVTNRRPRTVELDVDRSGASFSGAVGAFRCWPGVTLPRPSRGAGCDGDLRSQHRTAGGARSDLPLDGYRSTCDRRAIIAAGTPPVVSSTPPERRPGRHGRGASTRADLRAGGVLPDAPLITLRWASRGWCRCRPVGHAGLSVTPGSFRRPARGRCVPVRSSCRCRRSGPVRRHRGR